MSIALLIRRVIPTLLLGLLSAAAPLAAQTVVLDEDFASASATTPPAGWTRTVLIGDPIVDGWRFDNPGGVPVVPPLGDPVAICNATFSTTGGPVFSQLDSPTFDASTSTTILLEWDQWHEATASSVVVFVFDGVDFVPVYTDFIGTGPSDSQSIDITAIAAGVTDCRLRFEFFGDAGWWQVDNVVVQDPTIVVDPPTVKISKQPPVFNSPTGECPIKILGIGSSCNDDVNLQGMDIDIDHDRIGPGYLPHSGQAVVTATDLTLRGRDEGTNLQIARRHMTCVTDECSMFGPAWAFNYDHTFVEQPNGDLEMRSFGRTDTFPLQEPNVWEGGPGRFERMSFDGIFTSTLRMADGRCLEFRTEPNTEGNLIGRLDAIVSPNGNRIDFDYEDGLAQPDFEARRLLCITESYGRTIDFFYEDPNDDKLVTKIRDFSGREVHYSYDADGKLLGVTSPVVVSTGGLNDFPAGKTTVFGYLDHLDPTLDYALTYVVASNELGAGDFPRYQWVYDTDPASPTYGRLIEQTVGNPSAPGDLAAGGTFSYAYEPVTGPGDGPNDIVMRTTVTDRRGTDTLIETNCLGQILTETIFTQGYRTNEPVSRTRTFTYNDDGDLVQSVDPLGTTTNRSHVDPFIHPRTSRANESVCERPVDFRGGDQTVIRTETIYEPIFNRPFKVIDPRGFEAGNTPGQYTTVRVIDYMEDLNASRAYFAPLLGLTEAQLQALFDLYGIVSVGDVNGDGITDQVCGNVVRIEHPEVELPAKADRVGLPSVQQASETFAWNLFGQLNRHVDSEENVTVWEFYPAQDPDGDGVVDVPTAPASPSAGGYAHRIIRDAESGSGRNSGHDPTPVAKTTTFAYTSQLGGTYPANTRGVPTSIVDPRGIEHVQLVNELDQVVVSVAAADVGQSPEAGLTAFAYERVTIFDANDNIIEQRVRNTDGLDDADDFIVHRTTYDILDQRRSATADFGTGNLEIVERWSYDPSQNLTGHTRGVGTAEESTEVHTFDERDIVITRTRGFGTPEAATTATEIDDNGNVTARIDASGDAAIDELDGFDRVKRRFDPNGNYDELTYDAASNEISASRFGPVDHASAAVELLARSDVHYDERNRPFRTDDHLFHYPGKEVGALDDGALDPGDGLVSTITIYDRLGRAVGHVDADDDTFEARYDGCSRVVATLDPIGNRIDTVHDANDNVTRVIEVERSPLVPEDEIFETITVHDSLNRPTRVIEPNGQTTTRDYDSRGNGVRVTDALGNVTEIELDRLDREIARYRYLSADGRNASSTKRDPAQGGGDGTITTRQLWDALHRVVARIDDNGNVTVHTHDALDRRVRTDYADGTSETWTFNGDDELTAHTDQNGSTETITYDAGSRPLTTSIDNGGTDTIGTTLQSWGYDGLDRTTIATDDNGAGEDVTTEHTFDSLSRKIREIQLIGVRVALAIDSEWQGHARLVAETFANGRRVVRNYDALDRQSEIVEDIGAAVIAQLDYIGRFRRLRLAYGNDTVLDHRNDAGTSTINGAGAGFDANRRPIRHFWDRIAVGLIAGFESRYNATNRRVAERSLHLRRTDRYDFDSVYRMTGMVRDPDNVPSTARFGRLPRPSVDRPYTAVRRFDGTDKMKSFVAGGIDYDPAIDADPSEAGMNQYTTFDGLARTYTDNGSLADDGRFRYLYDFMNRLAEIRDAVTNGIVAQYLYAADNRRVLRTVGTVGSDETRYVYRGWRVLEERDGTDVLLRQYVHGPAIDEPIQLQDHTEIGSPIYYFHDNGQGFVAAITDAAGDTVELYEYEMLGNATILAPDGVTELPESQVGNPYSFQGRRFDPESGLYYFRNRYYSPRTGEHLTIDPLGPWHHGQGNGYSAFAEDPWNMLDPLGLEIRIMRGGQLRRDPAVVIDALQGIIGDCARLWAEPVHERYSRSGRPRGQIKYWRIRYEENPCCEGDASKEAWALLKDALDRGGNERVEIFLDRRDLRSGKTLRGRPAGVTYMEEFTFTSRSQVFINHHFLTRPGQTYGYTCADGVENAARATFPIVLWHEVIGHGGNFMRGIDHRHHHDDRPDAVHSVENIGRQAWNENHPNETPLKMRQHHR